MTKLTYKILNEHTNFDIFNQALQNDDKEYLVIQ